jgi:hypothetical protein
MSDPISNRWRPAHAGTVTAPASPRRDRQVRWSWSARPSADVTAARCACRSCRFERQQSPDRRWRRWIGRESQAITGLTFEMACVGRRRRQQVTVAPQKLLSIAVGALASARTTLAWTTAYVLERKAFCAPIARLQNTRIELAELTVVQAHVDLCLRQYLAGRRRWQSYGVRSCSQTSSIDACSCTEGTGTCASTRSPRRSSTLARRASTARVSRRSNRRSRRASDL